MDKKKKTTIVLFSGDYDKTLWLLILLPAGRGVKLIACTMTMDLLGLQQKELLDDLEYGDVSAYIGDAKDSNINLVI